MRAEAAAAPPVISPDLAVISPDLAVVSPDLAVISAAARSRGSTSCSGDIGEMYRGDVPRYREDTGRYRGDIARLVQRPGPSLRRGVAPG